MSLLPDLRVAKGQEVPGGQYPGRHLQGPGQLPANRCCLGRTQSVLLGHAEARDNSELRVSSLASIPRYAPPPPLDLSPTSLEAFLCRPLSAGAFALVAFSLSHGHLSEFANTKPLSASVSDFIFVFVSIVGYKLRAEGGVGGLWRKWKEAFGREIQLRLRNITRPCDSLPFCIDHPHIDPLIQAISSADHETAVVFHAFAFLGAHNLSVRQTYRIYSVPTT